VDEGGLMGDYNRERSDCMALGAPASTSNSTWTFGANFIFRGSDIEGTPKAIKVIGGQTAAGTGQARIQDITNSKTIATNTSITNVGKAIVDLGTLSNVGTGEAIWELQIKTSANTIKISAISVQY
jgi:hypothetical protein